MSDGFHRIGEEDFIVNFDGGVALEYSQAFGRFRTQKTESCLSLVVDFTSCTLYVMFHLHMYTSMHRLSALDLSS